MKTRVANRVLLVGWAGADWQVLRPLLDRGSLPTLANLVEVGVSGNLAPVQPMVSTMLATSMVTGKRADKHGVCSLFQPLADLSDFRPVSSSNRQCLALWNILSEAELSSHVVGWPVTHPTESVFGSMVSDQFVGSTFRPGVTSSPSEFASAGCHPQELSEALRPLLVSPRDLDHEAIAYFLGELASESRQHPEAAAVAQTLAVATSTHAVACKLLAEDTWDFAAVWYPTLAEWNLDLETPPSLQTGNEAAWAFQDKMLAALLETVGDDTTILLVSPRWTAGTSGKVGEVSFGSESAPIRRFGIACLAGPGIDRCKKLQSATVLDVAPTVLSLLGLPTGDDMDGRAWLEVFSDSVKPHSIATWEPKVDVSAARAKIEEHDEYNTDRPRSPSADFGLDSVTGTAEVQRACELILRNQRLNLALALMDSNRVALAAERWKELQTDYPEEPYYALQLMLCLIKSEQYDACCQFMQNLSPDISRLAPVQLTRAELALKESRKEDALQIARAEVERNHSNPKFLNQAGQILLECQAWQEAEAVFLESLKVQSDNPVARTGLSTAYWEQERYEESVSESRRVLKSAPSFTEARYNLARSLHSLGNDIEAIEEFEECLSLEFQPQESHYRLASLYRVRNPVRGKYHQIRSEVG